MHAHKQVIIPIDDGNDLSIITYEVPTEKGYGVDVKYELAIIGPEGVYHDNVHQFLNAYGLTSLLMKYFHSDNDGSPSNI
jgi:hypothetical protein